MALASTRAAHRLIDATAIMTTILKKLCRRRFRKNEPPILFRHYLESYNSTVQSPASRYFHQKVQELAR
jgi:hypothetical protein